jgi:hypothetical protein
MLTLKMMEGFFSSKGGQKATSILDWLSVIVNHFSLFNQHIPQNQDE